MGAPDDRSAASAPGRRRRAAGGHGCGEERVQLLQPLVEGDELVAALDQQVLAELVAPEHLQHQAAEIAEPFLARAQQCAPLPPELAWMRQRASRRRPGRATADALSYGENVQAAMAAPRDQCNSGL